MANSDFLDQEYRLCYREVAHRFSKYAREDAQGRVHGFTTPTRKMGIYSEKTLKAIEAIRSSDVEGKLGGPLR